MPSRQKLIFALVVLVIAGITGLGALWFTRAQLDGPIGSGTALVGGPFTLTDHNGKRVTDQDFRGKYMLIFFGFTYCPDVCPTELGSIAAALDAMGPAGERVTPVFVSVDPERDTPAALADYVSRFHPRMVGLTGSAEQVAQAARAYRVYYAKVRPRDASDYLMDHSSFIYFVGPDGRVRSLFRPETAPEAIAAAITSQLRAL
jgi:cytochrome oxidase Cu insertion factor (SCO1/SenC/PrrC family)